MLQIFQGRLALLTAVLSVALLCGCGSVISKEIRGRVNSDIAFKELIRQPELYKGETVIFSGEIIECVNAPDGTRLIILQLPVDQLERPIVGDKSEGRFIAFDKQYLDPAIYQPGRLVTAAGVVDDPITRSIGEINYKYPVIKAEQIHLWRPVPPPEFRFGFSIQQSF